MENMKGYQRASQSRFPISRQRRSGYEPSDTETEGDERHRNNIDLGLENPDLGLNRPRNKMPSRSKTRALSRPADEPSTWNWDSDESRNKGTGRSSSRYEDEPLNEIGELRVEKAHLGLDKTRNKSSQNTRKLYSTKFDDESSLVRGLKGNFPSRKYNISPHKSSTEYTPLRNSSPFKKTDVRMNVSPYKPVREGYDLVNSRSIKSERLENNREINNVGDKRGGSDQISENTRASEKSYYSHRSQSAPKSIHGNPSTGIKERDCSHRNTPPAGTLNEFVANAKISRTCPTNFESTESISQGDIFFSKEYTTMNMAMRKNLLLNKDNGRNDVRHKSDKVIGNCIYQDKRNSPTLVTGRTSMASDSFLSRQSTDKLCTTNSSKLSDMSTNTAWFVLSRKKKAEVWLSCLKRGTCKTLKPTDKVNEFDEATFIAKAFVVEIPRQFWADKHQPASLDDFTCHKKEAQFLKQLVAHDICPNILLKGPQGSGKKALVMAYLREIYGNSAQNVSHELRYFNSQDSTPVQVVIPSSAHHLELNAYTEPNIRHALIYLVKEISRSFVTPHEISIAVEKIYYKVIVLYDVDKSTQRIQHLIKWIMDGYTDSCKLILCCEDDKGILDSVKDRCKLVTVDAPLTHEVDLSEHLSAIYSSVLVFDLHPTSTFDAYAWKSPLLQQWEMTEVLDQIARKEELDLPMSFATKIANKSRHNLRHTIMALEACKMHSYPFLDDQPIPIGWEEIVEHLAAEILADPSHTRIFSIRGRFQKLLVEFVHPTLILQGLVKQFLKSVDGRSKRELYFWHAYYEKRLPTGSSALLKLEEFVAKFMSMHRRGTLFNSNIPSLTRR